MSRPIIDQLRMDDYLPLKKEGYNCVHTYRGLINTAEYNYWTSFPNRVFFQCDNVLCKYSWSLDKSEALKNKEALINNLVCKKCNKYNITATWMVYTGCTNGPHLNQFKPGLHWIHKVVADVTSPNGDPEDFLDKTQDKLYGIILHTHKQSTPKRTSYI